MKHNFEIEREYRFGKNLTDIEVTGRLNVKDLKKIEKIITTENVFYISFNYEQATETWQEINKMLQLSKQKFQVSLDYDDTPLNDLTFLTHLQDLETLTVDYFQGTDLTPIADLTKLKSLRFFNVFKSAKVRLKPLVKLKNLTDLKIFNVKDIDEIANFTELKKISLNSLKIDNLDFMSSLKNLEELKLRSSDKIQDFSGIYKLPKLKKALIIKNYKHTTAEFVSHLTHLEQLHILDFNSVETFPNLEKLTKLKSLDVTNCKILSDITGIAKAPNLKELSLFVGKSFKPSALNVLKGHKTLKEIRTGFNTNKENEEGELIINEIINKNYG